MSESTDERRAHARYKRAFDLDGSPTAGGASARMVASDLSLGGLYCTSYDDFPEMTRLSVRLQLDLQPAPLNVEAIVVRRTKINSRGGRPRFELALFFPRLTDDQRDRIARFLART